MAEKIKKDADKPLLVLTMNKHFPIYIAKIELFFNFGTKIFYLRPFVSSLPFPRF